MIRSQTEQIRKDLDTKMVFLVGPRQVGKTWLAREIGNTYARSVYLNYDHFDDKRIIHEAAWPQDTELVILDELHKMPGWKNHLKGIYDTRPATMRILVTGSARLDYFRQAGDSLAGRFFTHRLLPFSPAEMKAAGRPADLDALILRGGFPEPLLAPADADAKRWRNQYTDGLIRTDVLDFERVHDLQALRTVFELLRRSVGSPVSYASIARNVHKSPTTVMRYVGILEALFIVFRVTPYAKNVARSIIKEPKVYFYDTGLVAGDEGAAFENLVAVCLLKHAWGLTDIRGEKTSLHYLRTKEGHEVDFCLADENGMQQAVEVKLREQNVSRGLAYFHERYNVAGIQLVKELRHEIDKGGMAVRRAAAWLPSLFI